MRYKAIISYDGYDYKGWQKQPCQKTIQETLEQTLSKISPLSYKVVSSGRTDSGVHAKAQVIHFDTEKILPAQDWQKALNSLLPHSIKVKEIVQIDLNFHARFSAKSRSYSYYLKPIEYLNPWQTRYCWGVRGKFPSKEYLNLLSRNLLGNHDFTTFSSSKDPCLYKVRTIYKAYFENWEDGLVFHIEANSFLWHMVRSLVGTLIEFSQKGKLEKDFISLIENPDRSRVGKTAPACGLFLEQVNYSEI